MNHQREFAPLLELFPTGLVAIDLETTGLSPLIDRIIELIKASLQGASKPKPNQVRELPGGDVLISRCSSALAALIVCSPEVK